MVEVFYCINSVAKGDNWYLKITVTVTTQLKLVSGYLKLLYLTLHAALCQHNF